MPGDKGPGVVINFDTKRRKNPLVDIGEAEDRGDLVELPIESVQIKEIVDTFCINCKNVIDVSKQSGKNSVFPSSNDLYCKKVKLKNSPDFVSVSINRNIVTGKRFQKIFRKNPNEERDIEDYGYSYDVKQMRDWTKESADFEDCTNVRDPGFNCEKYEEKEFEEEKRNWFYTKLSSILKLLTVKL